MAKRLCHISGAFLLLCGIAPLIYGIFNMGTGALCVMGVFSIMLPFTWQRIGTRLRVFLGIAVFLAVLFFAVISAMMAYNAWFNKPGQMENATVVVLGAGLVGDQPSLMLRRRLNVAIEYLNNNPGAFCVVTGGQGPDEILPEAQVMANYITERGISSDRVAMELHATNTQENLRFSAELLREQFPERARDSVIVVTDSFHQMRASIFAEDAFTEAGDFYSLSSYTPWGLMPSYWVRDMFGVMLAWLQTR